jgi:hypothetical protein
MALFYCISRLVYFLNYFRPKTHYDLSRHSPFRNIHCETFLISQDYYWLLQYRLFFPHTPPPPRVLNLINDGVGWSPVYFCFSFHFAPVVEILETIYVRLFDSDR